LLKEALGLLWEQATYDQMRSFLHQWCAWADESGISQMRRWPELSSAIRAAFFRFIREVPAWSYEG
jgi:hypothetical protein